MAFYYYFNCMAGLGRHVICCEAFVVAASTAGPLLLCGACSVTCWWLTLLPYCMLYILVPKVAPLSMSGRSDYCCW